jgi:hypothetical protein
LTQAERGRIVRALSEEQEAGMNPRVLAALALSLMLVVSCKTVEQETKPAPSPVAAPPAAPE